MNILRAMLTGVLLWVLIFFEVSILMFGFNLEPGIIYYIIHYILLALFVILSSLIYFRGKRIKTGLGNGILLGIIFVIIGAVLDLVITVPLFIENLSGFYNTALIVGLIETVIVASIVGALKK